MIEAVKKLGEFILEQENKSEIDILLENPNSGNYNKVIVLEFDKDFNYSKVTVEDFKKDDWRIYLYRRKSSNGPDFTPTARITEPQKTLENKIIKWFEYRKKTSPFGKIYNQIESNKDKIIKDIEKIKNSVKKDEGLIITIKSDNKYLYEIDNPNFKDIFITEYLSDLKNSYDKNAHCSLCGEIKDEVFTTSRIYKFYTLDKPGYIAGGFKESKAWRNFPVCKSCYLKVDYGRKYIEENLKFNFYGKTYYLIPNAILDTEEVLQEYIDILSKTRKEITLKDKNLAKNYIEDENYILDLLKDYKDGLSFYFLFLKKDNSAERILLLIEDVLPSRISKIFQTKKEIEKIFNIQNYNFGFLNQFLNEYDKTFLEVIDKIFKGGKLEFNSIISIFNKKIRQAIYDDKGKKSYKSYGKDAVINVRFLEKIGLLDYKEATMDEFYGVYSKVGPSLNTDAKKGVFLLGVLTQDLLDIQYEERKSTPFFKNLKSFKMNEKDVKGLLAKVKNKLIEYDKYSYIHKLLFEEISRKLMSQNSLGMTVEELNFFFVAGMSLKYDVINTIYEILKLNKKINSNKEVSEDVGQQ